MTERICYHCRWYLEGKGGINGGGICDIVGDGQTCFAVSAKRDVCLFESGYSELSPEEVEKRGLDSEAETRRFRDSLKRATESVKSWPEWKQNLLG